MVMILALSWIFRVSTLETNGLREYLNPPNNKNLPSSVDVSAALTANYALTTEVWDWPTGRRTPGHGPTLHPHVCSPRSETSNHLHDNTTYRTHACTVHSPERV